MESLKSKDLLVGIDAGELVSFKKEQHEFIHQKGSPGWGHSDTEMFPIIGPTAEAGYRVHVPRGNAIQDQHGLLREMDYKLESQTDTIAIYSKSYERGSVIENSKYPERSTARLLIWPFAFQFTKKFELQDDRLVITFIVDGEVDMPFMIGYHPAFALYSERPEVKTTDSSIELTEVLEVGSKALHVPDCQRLTLEDKVNIDIQVHGFNQFMLWTEVPNMICIEPITHYPYELSQDDLHQGFMHLGKEPLHFRVELIPVN